MEQIFHSASKTLIIYRKTGEWLSLNDVGVKITIGGVSPDGSVRLEVESANATGYSFDFGPKKSVLGAVECLIF